MDKINEMYKFYLDQLQLVEEAMHPIQKIETKRAFMGGLSAMFRYMVDDLAPLSEDVAVLKLDILQDELMEYWLCDNGNSSLNNKLSSN